MKANKKQVERANKIMKDLSLDTIFMNKKGEFFTDENLALNSVKGKREDIQKIGRDADSDKTDEADKQRMEAEKKLFEIDVTQLEYPELRKMASALDVKLENEKQDTILQAIEARKAQLTKEEDK